MKFMVEFEWKFQIEYLEKLLIKFLKNNGRMSDRIPSKINRKIAGGIVEGFPDETLRLFLV